MNARTDYALLEQPGPVVLHNRNFIDASQALVFRGRCGQSLRELAPKTDLPTLCKLNGDFVLQEDWDWIPDPADHVAYLTLPKGGGDSNPLAILIAVVTIVVGVFTLNPYLIAAGAAILLSGLLPVPSFAPIADRSGEAASPTYNIQLSQNSARLGQAIPVMYGRHIIIPDFAAQPYSEYDEESDQYYHALLCMGQLDKFTLESVMVDDTQISHFVGVETQLYGPDYALPLTLVSPAVVNAPEVAGQELVYAQVVGPFAVCGPGTAASEVGIDVIAPRGLYYAEVDASFSESEVQFFFEARPIDDNGLAIGAFSPLGGGVETLSGSTNSQIRKTYRYTLPTSGRYEVQGQRVDVKTENNRTANEVQWAGMRAYLTDVPPLEASATFLALRMKATNQLSGLSQRRVSCIIRRWLPTWDPDTGWSAPVETTSIAWALADILRNTDYGARWPDSRIDLQTLYELDQLWADRGDEVNIVFDKRITVWQALTTVARCGRAKPILRGGVVTFVRDELQELPVALYSMRNIVKGSFSVDTTLPKEDDADGLEIEFFNRETWSVSYVTIPVPGVEVEDVVLPARMSLPGITDSQHLTREGYYMVADSQYRRQLVSFSTELDGFLPAYGSLIAVAHDVTQWGYAGDVVSYDTGTRLMTTNEQLTWTVGDHYAVVTDSYGDVRGPFLVTAGEGENTMLFDEPLGFVPYTGTEQDRSRYAMGPGLLGYAKLCRVAAILPGDDDTVQIKAYTEDNRVHTADSDYTGGGTGGTGGRLLRYMADDAPVYSAASEEQQADGGFFADDSNLIGADAAYVFDV